LSRAISVNLDMVHGGASWGFLTGARFDGIYQPDISSYDYGAPLDEAGRPTREFFLMREAIKKYLFELSSLGDTFLDMRGWGRGYVWVSGHNLGRYWKIGPQQCTFVPSMWLSKGTNQVLVLDLKPADHRTLQGIKVQIWSAGVS
jgi:beta-galactosidase